MQIPVSKEQERHHCQVGWRSAEILLQWGHVLDASDCNRVGGFGGPGQYYVRYHPVWDIECDQD